MQKSRTWSMQIKLDCNTNVPNFKCIVLFATGYIFPVFVFQILLIYSNEKFHLCFQRCIGAYT